MGKKKIRKAYTSKSQHSNVSSKTLSAMRRDTSPITKALNKMAAWRAGKNPWITVPGHSKNMAFVKVRANSLYGDPRYATANIFGKKSGDSQ